MSLAITAETALVAQQDTIVSCPFSGIRGTSLVHGFYVTNYPGNNLWRVTLGYGANIPGRWSISLTAHRNTYDGTVIGSTQTASADMPAAGETFVTFDFGGAPVSPGDTIAFVQTAGPIECPCGILSYDEGSGPCNGVFQTEGTNPPLDTVRHSGVGVSITQMSFIGLRDCVASDTALCLDDRPGDQRFQVTATFHTTEGGGRSGKAQAVPLPQLGALNGGLFWFFTPNNPEMLVKIVNGCAVNDHYWAFISAATNVGFSVTIQDTALANSQTYTNADLTAAAPVQDVMALASCHQCTSDDQCPSGRLCCSLPIPGTKACLHPADNGRCPLLP